MRLTPEQVKPELVELRTLRVHPSNARRGDHDLLDDSVQRHGLFRTIVVTTDNVILAGNHTYLAARRADERELWVSRVPFSSTDRQAQEIMLIDNHAADKATYDDKLLIGLLQSLDGDLSGTGFEDQDLADLLAKDSKADLEKTGAEPGELPAAPRTRYGDLYQLGEHRLLCGDATKPEDLDRLMDGEEATLLLTDPPYGIEYRDGGPGGSPKHRAIEGDTVTELDELLEPSLRNALAVSKRGGCAYVFHSEATGLPFRHAFIDAGWDLKQVLVWVKQQHTLGRQDYQWQHEPILYGWRPGAAHHWYGGYGEATVIDDELDIGRMSKEQLRDTLKAIRDAQETSVLRENRPHVSELHPTMKPVPLCARLISNSSSRGQIVLDPFAGSGSTLIAAENLGRRAYLIEIDNGYCDVVVDRYERHTGQAATLLASREDSIPPRP